MKKLITILLFSVSFLGFSQDKNTSFILGDSIFDGKAQVPMQLKAGSPGSPDGSILEISNPPTSWTYLNDNGYCYPGIPTTSTVTMCFTFVPSGSAVIINAGFSETCWNNSFGPFAIYDGSLNFVTNSLAPTGLIAGQTYTWCVTMRAWGGFWCNGYETFCPYWMDNSPLPVELYEFYGDCNALYWSTASESNNDYFIVESSLDGTNWTEVDRIDGAGTTLTPQTYTLNLNPTNRLKYYRLTQVDFDGQSEVFKTISVSCNKPLEIEGVYDMMGKKVANDLNGNFQHGIYLIKYSNEEVERIYL